MQSKLLIVSVFVLIPLIYMQAQFSLKPKKLIDGNTYALVIGISDYADNKNPDLQYADRDAKEFYDYLQSKSGGNVPVENLTLLTNKDATIANIYFAMNELSNKSQSGDRIYFYFSGHGDVESSLYKLGFLIAYDTPFGNYLNNAIRIEDLNIMANTLSVEKNVQVILITDACHSGKLAGTDNRGRQLVGEQLAKVEKNEIRLASCQSDQLSQEDKLWGGGRGAFSYYLVNGLTGMADSGSKDGIITLLELKNYLQNNVLNDVMNFKSEEQLPIVEGNNFAKISMADTSALNSIIQNSTDNSSIASGGSRALVEVVSQDSKLLHKLSEVTLRDLDDIEDWRIMTKSQVLDGSKNLFGVSDTIYRLGDTNLERKTKYSNLLATAFHNEVQKAVNAYLSGDKEELERRQYYNVKNNEFQKYINLLEIALILADSSSNLHHILRVKKHYFKGLNDRLNMVISSNPDSLANEALLEQNKAYKLDSLAAYVINELGVIHNYLKDGTSNKYYERAIALAPSWPLPYSNLSSYYYHQKNDTLGIRFARKAIELNPELFMSYINLGRNLTLKNNYLIAEENFLKASRLNLNHYLPFEELAKIYSHELKYELSNYYYNESEKRKVGFLIFDKDADGVPDSDFAILPTMSVQDYYCEYDTTAFGKNDVFAYFCLGKQYMDVGKLKPAINNFRSALKNNPNDPIIYKYLAVCYFNDNKFTEAEYFFNLAEENYLDYEAFINYANELQKHQEYLECKVYDNYIQSYFQYNELPYYLAEVYTRTKRYDNAIEIYKQQCDIGQKVAYFKLAELYSSISRFRDEELTWTSLEKIDSMQSKYQLKYFYDQRISQKDNADLYRYYNGILLYNMAMTDDSYSDFQFSQLSSNDISTAELIVPGTNEIIYQELKISRPATLALEYFDQIAHLTSYPAEFQAEIFHRMGDLYSYKGEYEKAKLTYQKAVVLNPNNASSKYKFIDISERFDDYENILEQLYALDSKGQLDLDLLKTYSEYLCEAGDNNLAKTKIEHCKSIELFPDFDFMMAETLNEYFLKNYNTCLLLLNELNDSNTIPSYEVKYTQARIFALNDNPKAAFDSLNDALTQGFNYAWVLHNDPIFESFKNNENFQKILSLLPTHIIEN
ncbi:MAG: caspase family protein [Lewinellaceae bacterium]|nr:caspase family protein [Lewinellaceae bacterium]